MKWLKRGAVAVGLVIALLAALPLFVSVDNYRTTIEREASARLKEPVTVKRLSVSLLPLPHVNIDGIAIGKSGDILLETIKLTPDVWSLRSATKIVKSVEIDGVMLTQKGIDKIPLWVKSGQPPGALPQTIAVQVRRAQLSNVMVKLDKVEIGPIDAKVMLDESGFPQEATLATRDGKLKALLKPEKSALAAEITGKGWRLPLGPAVLFDELTIKAMVTQTEAQLHRIDARLYGGTVSGNTTVSWTRSMQVKGQLEVKNVDMQPLLMAAGGKSNLSGRLNASPRISANAATVAQLANVLRMEGPFNVQNGVLHGVDIQKAATNLLSKESGGQTRFDQLSGYIVAQGGAQQVTQLRVRSGVLAANGNVNVSPRKELSGRINAQVKIAQVAAADVPLNVSGTVDSPVVLPTGAAVAGAAAGTAVLGPGVGTSVGVKIGKWADGLFGRKPDK